MIHVLHIITGLGIGGAEAMLCKLLSSMDRTRFANTVISLTCSGDAGRRISSLNVPVYALNIDGLAGGVRGLCKVVALIRAIQPHVIQTWLHHADLFGTIASKLSGNPNLVWNLRSSRLSPEEFTRRNLQLVRVLGWLSSIPRVVVVNSSAGRLAHIQVGYHPRRWADIPNGFDTHVFSPNLNAGIRIRKQFNINDDAVLIGLVGRYHPMKGHTLFLQAAKDLAQKRPAVKFVMVGRDVDGRNLQLRNQIRGLGLGINLLLLGERKDIPDLMNALDILTCSSLSEGFPNVIGEAMACGIPCVATDVGDSKIIIGQTGLVVPPDDAKALSAAWDQLLAVSPEDRQRLGRSARERIRAFYDIDVIAGRYQELYEGIAYAV